MNPTTREWKDIYITIFAGKAQQQTEQNVQKALNAHQRITQSSIDKIVHCATKKGSCTFTLNFNGSIKSIH